MLKQLQVKPGLTVVIIDNDAEYVAFAADKVCSVVRRKPHAVLGLATGSSPVGMYAELVARNRAGIVDFSGVRTFNLDEYVGLQPDHAQSYRHFMEQHLFAHINVAGENTHIPSGVAADMAEEARRYDAMLEQFGPIDLQVLGLGSNGHIGFNEPGTPFSSRTHVVNLADSTIEANSRFFAGKNEVPRKAITMGIASILEARELMLLAKGEKKARAIKAALAGPITPDVPASALQLHSAVVVVLDPPAAALLDAGDTTDAIAR